MNGPALDRLLEEALSEGLDDSRASRLAEVGEGEQASLEAAARELRDRGFGRRITYSPKVFIPLTKLCRDVCHYCTFARPPRPGERAYMSIDEIVEIAERGHDAGCNEALFTLGDKPELRYRVAREELAALGCETTVEYLSRAAAAVLERTGLLPHLNPGVLDIAELDSLREVSASMGMMLESSSERLLGKGMPHHGSPDKEPAVRLRALDEAGEHRVPFTTGILIGIGETRLERLEALLAIRRSHRAHGHVQEVIVQNFRAKRGTLMSSHAEPSIADLRWTIAVARLVLGPDMSVQAPPNLSDPGFGELLDAGINDWGGVSPVTIDHVNPEAPWPDRDRLAAETGSRGFELVPRLPVYPRYQDESDGWLDEAVRPAVLAASDSLGLGRRWSWFAGADREPPASFPGPGAAPPGGEVAACLRRVERGEELGEDQITTLFEARGSDLIRVVEAADRLRKEVCGDSVSYVVTRNINYTNVCYFRCGFCAFSKGKLAANLRGKPYLVPTEEVVRRCREAWDRGATEVCLQGGIHPGFDGDFYLDLLREVRTQVPGLHVHAFSPLEVWQGAGTLGVDLPAYLRSLRETGLGSLPGTAAEVLDDEVRAVLCPDKVNTAEWTEVVEEAHRQGLRTTSTIMFGHVDGPRNWARHLLVLRDIQRRTGGITEFVPLPFVHMEAPIALRGKARHGPTLEETLLMHAVGRLALHPLITNVQASWVKLGDAGSALMLDAGVNDLGGTLMNESISRAAGASHGQEMPPERMERLIRSAGRRPRQRTTFYEEPDGRQVARSFAAAPLLPPHNPPAKEAGLRPRRRLVRSGRGDRELTVPAESSGGER